MGRPRSAKPRGVLSPSPEHIAFLRPYGPQIRDLTLAVRELVLQEAPGAVELIYDAYSAVASGYSFTGRPSDSCVSIAVHAKWVNLFLWNGARMDDPDGLLEGAGKRIRHIKIRDAADLARPGVRALVSKAVAEAERPQPGTPKPKPESIVRAIYEKRRRPGGRA